MSAVGGLVYYFENLNDTMEPKKQLTRSSKSLHEKGTSKMKRLLHDFTEIKRPTNKQKHVDELEKSQTLPKNFRNTKGGSNISRSDAVKIKIDSNHRNKKVSESNVTETIHETGIKIEDNEIGKKVEEFGDTLRRRRKMKQKQIEEKEEPNHFLEPPVPEIVERKKSFKGHVIDTFSEDKEDSSDEFGFNNFDEDRKDNYILEAYNKRGSELVIITLEITRRTITQGEDKFIVISDYKEESEESSSNSTNSNDSRSRWSSSSTDSFEIDIREEKETSESFSQPSYLYNKILLNNSAFGNALEHEVVVYDEPYMSTYSNYGYNNNKGEKKTLNEIYGSVNGNFSVCEDNVPIRHRDDILSNTENNLETEKKEKIHYVIDEIKKTEEIYKDGLKVVVESYIPYIYGNTPSDLIGRTSYLFGNIEEIYHNTIEFNYKLRRNGSNDVEGLANIFINSASQFELYPLYSKNKPTADIYLKQFDAVIIERQKQLNDKLGLASYLLTPIQRLGKYVLLLEEIQKELRKADKPSSSICAAIAVIRNVMRKGNDYIAIDSIKDSEVDLHNKGSFIMRAPFNILKPRKLVSMVFLFENIVVFTEKISRNLEHFKYLDSISMSDLSLGKFEEKPNIFHLTNYSKSKRCLQDATFILEAETPKLKNEWTETIEKILWTQLEKAKEQQKKYSYTLDHKHTAKTPARSTAGSTKTKVYRKRSLPTKSKSRFYDHYNA